MFGTLLVTVGAFHVWWGGTSAPARPVASAVLLLGLPLAWAVQKAREMSSPALRTWCHLLLAVSVALALMRPSSRVTSPSSATGRSEEHTSELQSH